MRGRYRRGGGGGNFGLMLLVFQLINFIQYLSARNEFIPTTLILLGINVIAFIRPELNVSQLRRYFHWPSIGESCISVQTVWFQHQWNRLILAPFIHADSWHLYYNMASFMWKSRTLEKHYGSLYFGYIIAVFSILTSIVYVVINYLLAEVFNVFSYVTTCAIGFSGVIFAIKVLTTHLQPNGMTYVFMFPIPTKLAVWAELILISVLFPNVSFVGHLAGILVGLTFVSGPLKQIMDLPINMLSGNTFHNFGRPSYNYTVRPSGTRSRRHEDERDEQVQEAIRRSWADRYNYNPSPPPPYNPEYEEDTTRSHGRYYESYEEDSQPSASYVDDIVEERQMSVEDIRAARLRRLSGDTINTRRRPNY